MNRKITIFRNTAYLYIRSLITLLLQLYTSRIILEALGVEEFGVYQVVGGLVATFSFLNSTMAASTQRFLSYEIGIGNKQNIQKIFSTAINIHFLLAFLIFVLVEIIGVAFLKTNINLGNVDLSTAMWILHFTALSLVLTITSVPYNSFLISKENMSYFAYIDILGAILKLLIAFLLIEIQSQKLIWYAILLFVVSAIIRLIYAIVCHKKYVEARYNFVWDKELFKKMIGFSGWTTLSAFTYMVKSQGVSIILNVFFGPLLNTSVGIANQVNAAIKTFSQNFQMSFMPQIVKTYAQEEYTQMNKVIYSGAKLSTYLLIAVSVPIMLEVNYILSLWLVNVPEYASGLICLILIESIFQTMTCTGNTAIRATGNVKWFELCYNGIELLAIPLIIVYLYLGYAYYTPFIIGIIFIIISSFVKMHFIKKQISGFNKRNYIIDIFLKSTILTLISVIGPYSLRFYMPEGVFRVITVSLLFETVFFFTIYMQGLNNYEKLLVNKIMSKLKL